MQHPLVLTIALIANALIAPPLHAQQYPGASRIDSTLAKKITIDGICLCQTTVRDLQNQTPDLHPVEVEEMDLGRRCFGTDSRYENGKGYASEKFPGMIFQKSNSNEYIGKIRLTAGFHGQLPDGSTIDMDHLLLKDVFAQYPDLKKRWGSRDCSDYWSFSNDTLLFYVRIDPAKKPQYPIDENYYLDKPVAGIDLTIACYGLYHQDDKIDLFPANEPVFFIDSIRTNSSFLKQYSPSEIAYITVLKDSNAIKAAGPQGRNGVVYITTKHQLRLKYWTYLRGKSAEYRQRFPDLQAESTAAYILNGKPLAKDQEMHLSKIDDSNFRGLQIIEQKTLEKTYHISDKAVGIVITTNP